MYAEEIAEGVLLKVLLKGFSTLDCKYKKNLKLILRFISWKKLQKREEKEESTKLSLFRAKKILADKKKLHQSGWSCLVKPN